MTSDLRIQGEVVVNSEQAESAFNRVGDKAQQMANEVATSANKAGQSVDKIGDGAGASAEKFTRAESRISASIKRATNELELLGKTASQRLEFNISDKGLDPKKFEPMLQRLREVEQRAREAEAAATGSLNNMGMSARATAAAMRGVPAQFQDIIVSLQGGQAPMTVLLQQGSQLSGMFGGAGNAAKALGTYIVGLVNPLTIAAAAVAGLGFAMYSLNGKDAALRELSAQLIGTGRASAAAVGDIKSLVNELNTVPGVSKAAATAIIGEFAKVSGLGSSLFKGLGSSVADFAAATGTDLPTAAKKLAEAFADPAKGAKALEDSLGTLTAAQILTITKMAEMGDKSGAQAALLDALKQATEGLAKQGMTPLGEATDKMSNAWDKLTTSVGTAKAGTSALSTVGSIGSGYSLLSGMGAFGGGISGGFGGLMGSLGLSATGSTLGGALSAGSIALQSGNILGGLGTFVGALGPIALGLGALTSLLGSFKGETRTGGQFGVSFDGTVTNQRRGQTYTYQGQQFDRDFSNGQRNALIAGQAYRLEGDPVQNEQAIRDAVSGTASGINAFLKALGSKATLTGFSAGLETSSKGRGGVFAGGILSNGTTFGESGKGDNYSGTLYEKFSTNSPDFKTALEDFTLDLKQSTIQALQTVTDIPETVKKMLKGVDAEGLSEEAANALLESINAQIVGVQNLTSSFEAMGLDKLAKMGFDAAAGLAAAAGGFDKLQGNLNTYYDNFYTDEEKRANLQKQVDKQFAELGIDVPKNRDEFRRLVEGTLEQVDVQDKARASLSKQINDAIAGAGKDGFTLADAGARSIVSGINPALLGNAQADPALAGKLNGFLSGISDLADKGLDPAAFQDGLAGLIDVNTEVLGIGKDASKTAATLLGLSGVFAQLNESADDAAARIAKEQADARDKALRGLERAIDAEKKALQSQIDVAREVADTMSGLFDLLKTNVQELYGEVDSTRAMLAVQGNDFITQALVTARTTGYLPDQTQLADAISAARGGLDSSGYASQFELDRDRLVLAGKLSELEGLTGKQLTSAELTVRELESQSEQLDQTLEYWKQQIEIANGTYEATLSVADAIKELTALTFPETNLKAPEKIPSAAASGGAVFGGGGSGGGSSAPSKVTISQTGLRTYADGSTDQLTANELDLYLRGILGKVPAFAVGTDYVPRDMLAQIHEGEAIVPKAYNPAANPGMGGGNGQMESLMAALLEQNARLETRLAAIEGHTQDTSRATNGNPISPVPMALVENETV